MPGMSDPKDTNSGSRPRVSEDGKLTIPGAECKRLRSSADRDDLLPLGFDTSAYGFVLPRPLHPVHQRSLPLPESLPVAGSLPVWHSLPLSDSHPVPAAQANTTEADHGGLLPVYDSDGIIISYVNPMAVRKITPSLRDGMTLQRDVDVPGTNNATKQPLTSGQTGSAHKPSLSSPGSSLTVEAHGQSGGLPPSPTDIAGLIKYMHELQAQSLSQMVSLLKANNTPQDNSSLQSSTTIQDEAQGSSEEEEEYYSDEEDYDEEDAEEELDLELPVFAQLATSGSNSVISDTSGPSTSVPRLPMISTSGSQVSAVAPGVTVPTSGVSNTTSTSGLSFARPSTSVLSVSGTDVQAEPSFPVAGTDTVDRDSPLSFNEVRACLLKHGFACNVPAPAVVHSIALDMLGCGPRQTEMFKLLESNLVRSAWEVFDAALVPARSEPLSSCGTSNVLNSHFTAHLPKIGNYLPSFYSAVPVPVPGKEPLPSELLLDKEVTAFGFKPSGLPITLSWPRCKAVQDNIFRGLSALSFADNAMAAALLETMEANTALIQDSVTLEDVNIAKQSLAVSHRTMGSAMQAISHCVQLLVRASANITTSVRSSIIQDSILDETLKDSLLHVPMHSPSIFGGLIPLAASRHQSIASYDLKRSTKSSRGRPRTSQRAGKRSYSNYSYNSNRSSSHSRVGSQNRSGQSRSSSSYQEQADDNDQPPKKKPFRGKRGGVGGRGRGTKSTRGAAKK